MASKNANRFANEWLRLRRELSEKDKLFLEVLTYSFIGTQSKHSNIVVERVARYKTVNGKRNTSYEYTILVELGDEEGGRD